MHFFAYYNSFAGRYIAISKRERRNGSKNAQFLVLRVEFKLKNPSWNKVLRFDPIFPSWSMSSKRASHKLFKKSKNGKGQQFQSFFFCLLAFINLFQLSVGYVFNLKKMDWKATTFYKLVWIIDLWNSQQKQTFEVYQNVFSLFLIFFQLILFDFYWNLIIDFFQFSNSFQFLN